MQWREESRDVMAGSTRQYRAVEITEATNFLYDVITVDCSSVDNWLQLRELLTRNTMCVGVKLAPDKKKQ